MLERMSGNGESCIEIDLAISAAELMKLYRGSAQQVVGEARDGRVVRFPARRLQPFITRSGVRGRFRLVVDSNKKLQRIEKLF